MSYKNAMKIGDYRQSGESRHRTLLLYFAAHIAWFFVIRRGRRSVRV
jgi:hypothetical protein